MHASMPVLSPDSAPYQALRRAAEQARCVAICGIPGAGKSLLVREQTLIARQRGRTVHTLLWDVARQAFDQPRILAVYPELDNVTHPVIRRAAGLWVREAVADWYSQHPEPEHLLVIEAPLVGGRFVELARRESDRAEVFLSSVSTRFLVPLPSREVRAAIEAARARDMAQHSGSGAQGSSQLHGGPHEQGDSPAALAARALPGARYSLEGKSAPPLLVDALWQMLLATADSLGLPRATGETGYSPEIYFAVYERLLRHRHVAAVPVSQVVVPVGSMPVYEWGGDELAPSASEAARLIRQVEAAGIEQAIRFTEQWHVY